MVKIVLADDEEIIRDCIKFVLEQNKEIEVVGCAQNGLEAFELCGEFLPDVVLMDIMMPEVDGVEGTRLIKETYASTRVIILTTSNDQENIMKALRFGADGYVLKDIDPDELVATIKSAVKGLRIMHDDAFKLMVSRINSIDQPMEKKDGILDIELNEKEISIIRLIVHGKSNKEIATELFMSEGTVRNIISIVLTKFGLSDRTQLAVFALKNNLA